MYAPKPRFITPLDPTAPSDGREISVVARALGKPFMPHQRTVAYGATERTPLGLYKYSRVLILFPRQSGKTTMVAPVQIHRIMTQPRLKAFYTAQTGKDAGKRMRDVIELVNTSPLKGLFKTHLAAGAMGLSLANGSRLSTFAGPENIHGETPGLVTLDEIWKHDQARGNDFAGAIGPAQATLEGLAQTWYITTMGTANSGMLNDLIEQGMAGVPGLFFAWWGMPDGSDPYEPKTWWSFHPALGNTITETTMANEAAALPRGEWIRAYMNRRDETATDPLIPADDWDAMAVPAKDEAVPSRRAIAVSYETYGGNSAVMATWRNDAGDPCTRVLHAGPGDGWLVPFIEQLADEWRPAVIAADDGGDTRRITDTLRRRNDERGGDLDVFTTGGADFATACAGWIAAARDKQLRHDGSKALSRANAHAQLQHVGDSVRLSRKNSTGPTAALIASVVGLWAFDHRDPEPTAPVIRF